MGQHLEPVVERYQVTYGRPFSTSPIHINHCMSYQNGLH